MRFSSTPAWSLLGRQENSANSPVPGPGSYSPRLAPSTPSYGLAGRLQPLSAHSLSPGPGTYTLPNERGKSPKYSFGTKGQNAPKGSTPAPGTYELPSSLSKTGGAMGKKLSVGEERSLTPGPGAYHRETFGHSGSPSFRMGTGRRSGEAKCDQSPGPGAYLSPSRPAGLSYSIQGRHGQPRYSSELPGPGQYDVSGFASVRDRPRTAVMFGEADRPKAACDSPGPGKYQVSLDGSGPKWGFGQEKKLKIRTSDTPAPGSYHLPNFLNAGGFSLGKRLETPERGRGIPGPGAYDTTKRDISPSFRMGPSPRSRKEQLSDSPGPGAYYIPLRPASPAYTMGGKLCKNGKDSPGPGTYDIPSSIGKNTHGFSIGGRIHTSEGRSRTPGPGQYGAKLRSNSPSFKFSREARHSPAGSEAGLGPGTYFSPLKPSPPSWSFGSKERPKTSQGDLPGPGHYDFKPSVPDPALYGPYKR